MSLVFTAFLGCDDIDSMLESVEDQAVGWLGEETTALKLHALRVLSPSHFPPCCISQLPAEHADGGWEGDEEIDSLPLSARGDYIGTPVSRYIHTMSYRLAHTGHSSLSHSLHALISSALHRFVSTLCLTLPSTNTIY